jgi:aldehyde dehydrogenase
MKQHDPMIAAIVEEVLERLQPQLSSPSVLKTPEGSGDGVFATIDEAVRAATTAQEHLAGMGLEERGKVIELIRQLCSEKAGEWGRMELEETRIGRLDHKIEKLKVIRNVLGVEALKTEARSDSSGVCIIEYAPFGVIGMVLPATHSVPTMASNAINVIAGGNTAVFSPHPAAAKCTIYALKVLNREIERHLGLRNLMCTVHTPSIETANALFNHPDIELICVTGGPAVVKAAMQAGKRVIAAGPGNPPVVVDETADFDNAAKSIIEGGGFDNNLLCIGEKEVFVVASAAEAFIAAMKRAGAVQLNSTQIEQLTRTAFTFEQGKGVGCARAHVNREHVGKDAAVLAELVGLRVPPRTELLFGETPEDHPFVQEEQMMPFVPVVRVPTIDDAIRAAVKAERGYRHTAIIHSQNLANITKMGKAMNTTLFVVNAPCTASLGANGPGYLSYSIATPTGEGVTTPLTFLRQRQLTVGRALRLI